MKRIHGFVVFSLLLSLGSWGGCGGSATDDDAATREVQVRVGEPAALVELPPENRKMKLELYFLVEGVEGSEASQLELTPNSDRTAWNGEATALSPGRYVVKVYLVHPWDSSPVASANTGKEQEDQGDVEDVSVALFRSEIDVVVGQNQIILDIAPADISTDIDDDSDGLSNLVEILGTTDPFNEDTDGDGVRDGLDVFPNLSAEFGDGDGDGIGDNTDNCLTVSNSDQADFDVDHQGDACDPDDDNDGLEDSQEATLGSDPFLPDSDKDGTQDGADNCLLTANLDQIDSDGDGVGNLCDPDDDNDGIPDSSDNCPFFKSLDQTDSNGDGIGDVCTDDDDGDGVPDGSDNCRIVANSNQIDTDSDGSGDACDPDDDNDTLPDSEEDRGGSDNLITSRVSADSDGDGISDPVDNCPITPNSSQESNGDSDGEGDACDCNRIDPEIRTRDAVFVSPSGNDSNDGARNAPVKSISKGISLAKATGKSRVYVSAGSYPETVSMASGVSVFGGFNVSFDGSACEKKLFDGLLEVNTVQVLGPIAPVVTFSNITSETRLEGVVIETSGGGSSHIVEKFRVDPNVIRELPRGYCALIEKDTNRICYLQTDYLPVRGSGAFLRERARKPKETPREETRVEKIELRETECLEEDGGLRAVL